MARARRQRPPQKKTTPQRRDEPAQSTLDPWLQSAGDAGNIPDEALLELSAPVGDDAGDGICCDQDTNPSQHTAPGRPSDNNQVPSNMGLGISLETEVKNGNGITSTVTNVISNQAVAQAQQIISSARDKPDSEQKAAICDAIEKLYPYRPRNGQQDALHHLIYHKKDLVLIAKTSFGKSMILQATSILQNKTISLIILPLEQIGKEQSNYIKRIGGQPCFLNADTINDRVLKNIRTCQYTHVLLSPELAVSDKLCTVFTAVAFKEQLALVAVDEAHLVSQWGKHFRTDYARLGTIRNFLGRDIPWFACSATLAESTLQDMIQGIGFDADITILRTSINRPELLLRVGFIPKGTRRKFTALRYTFDPDPSSTSMSLVEPSHITKSVVFFDSKQELRKAYGSLLTYLQKHERYQYSRQPAQTVLRTFTRDTHDGDKDDIIKEFQKLATDSSVRVIFATEALGMGADLPDIKQVIQYGVPKSLDIAVLWQRGGRACRNGQPGDIILLIEHWMKGDRAPPPLTGNASLVSEDLDNLLQDPEDDDNDNDASGQKKPSNLTPSQRRGRLPDIWYQLANNHGCIRTIILDHFSEPAEYRHETRKDRCCSNCSPSYYLDDLDSSRYYLYQEQGYIFGKPQQAIAHDIHQWAERQYPAVYQDKRNRFRPNAHCFLSTGQQKRLASHPFEIINPEDLPDILGPWQHLDAHGDELTKVRKASRANHLHKKRHTSTGRYGQSQPGITNGQMDKVLSPHSTIQFASQPVSQQSTLPMSFTRTIGTSNSTISCAGSSANKTPSRPASQLDPVGFLTPSQATLYIPLPDLSMSTRTVSTDISPGPATPTLPVVSNVNRKRQPLGDISGNVPRKRTRRVGK